MFCSGLQGQISVGCGSVGSEDDGKLKKEVVFFFFFFQLQWEVAHGLSLLARSKSVFSCSLYFVPFYALICAINADRDTAI